MQIDLVVITYSTVLPQETETYCSFSIFTSSLGSAEPRIMPAAEINNLQRKMFLDTMKLWV